MRYIVCFGYALCSYWYVDLYYVRAELIYFMWLAWKHQSLKYSIADARMQNVLGQEMKSALHKRFFRHSLPIFFPARHPDFFLPPLLAFLLHFSSSINFALMQLFLLYSLNKVSLWWPTLPSRQNVDIFPWRTSTILWKNFKLNYAA